MKGIKCLYIFLLKNSPLYRQGSDEQSLVDHEILTGQGTAEGSDQQPQNNQTLEPGNQREDMKKRLLKVLAFFLSLIRRKNGYFVCFPV